MTATRYIFRHNGPAEGFVGRVTGQRYTWQRDEMIVAPPGEFDGAPGRIEQQEVAITTTLPAPPDATEAAVRLAAEAGIDLRDVTGTGQDGRIRKRDVEKAAGGIDG